MSVDADRLAEVLAQRFEEVTPDGIHVAADDGMLWYSSDSDSGTAGSYVRCNLVGAPGESDEEDLVHVTVQVLDQLQDFVSETTTDPWPGKGTSRSRTARSVAAPCTSGTESRGTSS